MIAYKAFGVREIVTTVFVAAVLLMTGAFAVHAQSTTFTPPTGYTQYQNTGIYYSPTAGQFYNPVTGQYSTLIPLGEAPRGSNGSYTIPSGYNQYGTTDQYYNSTTGYYYDPASGFYSMTAPMSTGVTWDMARNYGGQSGTTGGTGSGTVTPGVPNTGMGGDAAKILALLTVTGTAALLGTAYISRRAFRV